MIRDGRFSAFCAGVCFASLGMLVATDGPVGMVLLAGVVFLVNLLLAMRMTTGN